MELDLVYSDAVTTEDLKVFDSLHTEFGTAVKSFSLDIDLCVCYLPKFCDESSFHLFDRVTLRAIGEIDYQDDPLTDLHWDENLELLQAIPTSKFASIKMLSLAWFTMAYSELEHTLSFLLQVCTSLQSVRIDQVILNDDFALACVLDNPKVRVKKWEVSVDTEQYHDKPEDYLQMLSFLSSRANMKHLELCFTGRRQRSSVKFFRSLMQGNNCASLRFLDVTIDYKKQEKAIAIHDALF